MSHLSHQCPAGASSPEPSSTRSPPPPHHTPHNTRVSAGESCVTGWHSPRSPQRGRSGDTQRGLFSALTERMGISTDTSLRAPGEHSRLPGRFCGRHSPGPGPRPHPRRPGSPRRAPAGRQRPATSGTRSRRRRPEGRDPRAAITGEPPHDPVGTRSGFGARSVRRGSRGKASGAEERRSAPQLPPRQATTSASKARSARRT